MRKIKYIFIIVFCLTNNFSCFSQNPDSLYRRIHSDILSLSISPISLVDGYSGSSLKLGTRYKPIERLAIGLDFGFYLKDFTSVITYFNDMNGINLKAHISFYPIKNKPISLGLLYKYKYQNFNYNDSIINENQVKVDVSRNSNALNLVAGYDLIFDNRFFIEFQLGIGARLHHSNNSFGSDFQKSAEWRDSQQQFYLLSRNDILFDATFSMRLSFVVIKRDFAKQKL